MTDSPAADRTGEIGMSQRHQVMWDSTNDRLPAVIVRLAQKIQAADGVEGIERPWEQCVVRARENWRFVNAMAGAKAVQP